MSDGRDDLRKNRLQKSPTRATRDATRACGDARAGGGARRRGGRHGGFARIATAGGAEASARSRHLGLHNALLGGVDVKSILPVVEARFALAGRWRGRARRRGGERARARRAASGRVAGADADVQNAASPSVDRDSKRARVVAGSTSGDDAGGPVHVTGAPTQADPGRTTSVAFGLARGQPGVRAGGRAPGARARRRRVARRVRAGPPREGGSRVRRRAEGAWNFANAHRAVVNALSGRNRACWTRRTVGAFCWRSPGCWISITKSRTSARV